MEKKIISEKPGFFRAKNATVSTERSGTDYCWLYILLIDQGPLYVELKASNAKKDIFIILTYCGGQNDKS